MINDNANAIRASIFQGSAFAIAAAALSIGYLTNALPLSFSNIGSGIGAQKGTRLGDYETATREIVTIVQNIDSVSMPMGSDTVSSLSAGTKVTLLGYQSADDKIWAKIKTAANMESWVPYSALRFAQAPPQASPRTVPRPPTPTPTRRAPPQTIRWDQPIVLYVKSRLANVRAEATKSSSKAFDLRCGDQVSASAERPSPVGAPWYNITVGDGRSGWADASHFQPTAPYCDDSNRATTAVDAARGAPHGINDQVAVKSTIEHANVRERPSIDAPIVWQAMPGTRLDVLNVSSDGQRYWYEVRTETGDIGYISAKTVE